MEKKRKNVLIITHYFWPEDFKINELALGLSVKYNVSVLTGNPSYPTKYHFKNFKKKRLNNLSIFRVPVYKRGKSNLSIFLNYLTFLFSLPLFGLFLLKGKNFDFIFVYQPSPVTVGLTGIIFKYFKNCRMALWINDLWPDTIDHVNSDLGIFSAILRQSKFIFRLITNIIYRYTDYILVQSQGFKKKIKQKKFKKKIYFFPNWIDTTKYKKKKIDKKYKTILKSKIFKFMYFGNIGYSQDFHGVIKILKVLKEKNILIYFIVAGEGRDKINILKEVRRLNLQKQIYFIGRVKKEFIKNYATYSDMLFLSLRKNKLFNITIPAKLQTYLSLNKPIFGLISGETANLITSLKCGVSVNSGDYKNAAKKIVEILKNKRILKNFSHNKTNKIKNRLEYKKIIIDLNRLIDQ